MNKHLSRTIALVLFGVACPSVASGASSCRVVDGTDPAALTPAWRSAVESLRREVAASLDSACTGMELVLTTNDGGVQVTARASDGRETRRRVASPAGLSAVAFGLLAAAPGEVVPVFVSPPDAPSAPPKPLPPPPPAPAPTPEAGVSFSAATGVRAAFPSRVLLQDFEIRADSVTHDWLVTVHVRAAPLVLAMPGTFDVDAFQETGFGLGFGRQVRLGPATLAITGAADVAYVWIENDALALSSERAQLRVAAVARVACPLGRAARLNATLDGELSPTGLVNRSSAPGLLEYPSFTLGLRVGAEVLL